MNWHSGCVLTQVRGGSSVGASRGWAEGAVAGWEEHCRGRRVPVGCKRLRYSSLGLRWDPESVPETSRRLSFPLCSTSAVGTPVLSGFRDTRCGTPVPGALPARGSSSVWGFRRRL